MNNIQYQAYSEEFKPKPSWEKYAYYVDESNVDIMRNVFDDSIADMQYRLRERERSAFNECILTGPFLLMFQPDKLMKVMFARDINYVNTRNYTIVKIVKHSLMTIE